MITAAELEAAPVGSRIVFDWEENPEIRTVYRKTAEGWRNTLVAGHRPSKPTLPASSTVLAEVWDGDNRVAFLPPRIPAPIRLWSWHNTIGTPYYSWKCRVCPEWEGFEMFYTDSDEAHDKARSHAALHAEVTAP